MEQDRRFREAQVGAWLGITVNILLTIIKGVVGVMSNSKALLADAVHSASDIGGSLAVYIGLKAAKQPPDEDHPYGHGKAETVAAIIVSVLLFIAGVQIGKSSIQAFFSDIETPGMLAIYAVIFSIVVKEALFRYKYRLGKKLKSDALIVNAYEHRSDVYSSIAALVGIGASIAGNKLGIRWLEYGDPIAGVAVSLLVLWMAWKLGSQSIHNTLDHVLPKEETAEFTSIILSVPGVRKIGALYARENGYYVIIDLKISVDPLITVEEGHKIGKQVKTKLMKLPNVHDVLVHINPDDLNNIETDESLLYNK